MIFLAVVYQWFQESHRVVGRTVQYIRLHNQARILVAFSMWDQKRIIRIKTVTYQSAGLRFRLNLLQFSRYHYLLQIDTVIHFYVYFHAVAHLFQNGLVQAGFEHQCPVVRHQNLVIPVGIRFRPFIFVHEQCEIGIILVQAVLQVLCGRHRLAAIYIDHASRERNLLFLVRNVVNRAAHLDHSLRPSACGDSSQQHRNQYIFPDAAYSFPIHTLQLLRINSSMTPLLLSAHTSLRLHYTLLFSGMYPPDISSPYTTGHLLRPRIPG